MPASRIPKDEDRCTAHVNDGTFQGHRCQRPKVKDDDDPVIRQLCKQHRAGELRSRSLATARQDARENRQQVAMDLSKELNAAFVADFMKDTIHISLASAEKLLERLRTEGTHNA